MGLTTKTKEWIAELVNRVPVDKRERFMSRLRERLQDFDEEPLLGYAIAGAIVGALVEIVPGLESLTGIDDGVEAGAAIGAAIGFSKGSKAKAQHEEIRKIILEEVRRAVSER